MLFLYLLDFAAHSRQPPLNRETLEKPSDISLVAGGTINLQTVTKTANYTAASEVVIICDATSGDLTITLPTAVGITGRIYYIKRIDGSANTVTVDGNGSETIDDGLTITLSQYDCLQIVSDGTEWWIL